MTHSDLNLVEEIEVLLSGGESFAGWEEVGHQREGGVGELGRQLFRAGREAGGEEAEEFRVLTQSLLLSRLLGQPLTPLSTRGILGHFCRPFKASSLLWHFLCTNYLELLKPLLIPNVELFKNPGLQQGCSRIFSKLN